ncbi:hypothetical protein EIP86_005955 [Pleurotus ostreatoroseus]|nr:hypothetical protein EIP86_005955 [Pleurotus ostreatoroseus]
MYSQSYNSPPPELSNNPFIDHPTNALNRYPDINGTDSPAGTTSQFTSWLQPQGSNLPSNTGYGAPGQTAQYNGYQAPQQQAQTGWPGNAGGYPQQQQQQQTYNSGYASPVGTQPTGRPFQPSSSFGQQLAGQINATYGPTPQQQQQQQPQQYAGYQTSPQYGSAYGYAQQQQQPQQTTSSPHPREYIQQNKAQMEAWDAYTWRQALNAFDGLREAWSTRKLEIEARARVMGGAGLFSGGGGYGGYGGYGQAQEVARLEQMAKQAESNADTVVAAKFQMQEVEGGYRQSGDLASKKRVRESINAALTNLPDWPPQQW